RRASRLARRARASVADRRPRADRGDDHHGCGRTRAAGVVRLPHRPGTAEPDPDPRSRPAWRARTDHADPRRRADQPRGLRAAPRVARVRRRARDPRRGSQQRCAGSRAAPAGGLFGRLEGDLRAVENEALPMNRATTSLLLALGALVAVWSASAVVAGL